MGKQPTQEHVNELVDVYADFMLKKVMPAMGNDGFGDLDKAQAWLQFCMDTFPDETMAYMIEDPQHFAKWQSKSEDAYFIRDMAERIWQRTVVYKLTKGFVELMGDNKTTPIETDMRYLATPSALKGDEG